MEHFPSKIPKLLSNLLLSSAPSHTDSTTEPCDGPDFSARMEKHALRNSPPTPLKPRSRHFNSHYQAIPLVVPSTQSPTRKVTESSQAIDSAVNAKSRISSIGIFRSPASGKRRASLVPQPEQAQTASNSTPSPKVPPEPRLGARISAPKTESLRDAAQFSRQLHESPTLNPINLQAPSKPTISDSLSQIKIFDRGKRRGSTPNPVGHPPSQKPRPQIGNKRNSGDSDSSMLSNGQKRGSEVLVSGAILSGGVRQQQGPTGVTNYLKGSHSLDQSRKKLLQMADAINTGHVDPTRDAVTHSSLSGSITNASSVGRSINSSKITGFSLVADDVGRGLHGAETDTTDAHRDEDILIYRQRSWQGDMYQERLDIISAHPRVDMTTSSIREKSEGTWSPNPRSKIPRSTRHSLGAGRPLPAIFLNEDASPVSHASILDPTTFESDRLRVPGVRSNSTKAPLGGDSGRMEEAGWLGESNNSPSVERDEILSSTLESLMEIHKPRDLSNEVLIPDYRKAAHGGIAIVYAGIWEDRQVAVKVLRVHRGRNVDWDASNERRLRREINVWAALKHPNISEFLGYSTGFSDFEAMISHWCPRGTALEYLESQDLPVSERIKLVRWKEVVRPQIDAHQAQDVSGGLKYLHDLKIIHGDLKPSNVLVDDDYVAKLCDFGLVRLADWNGPSGMTTTSPYMGTERYKAPELFISADNRHPRATFEGDIYSLGCLMVEFIEQIYPFQRFTKIHQLRSAIMDGYSPALRSETIHALKYMTDFFWNLLEACWGELPSRPQIDAIVDALGYFAKAIPDSA